jgi:hypothetical protein
MKMWRAARCSVPGQSELEGYRTLPVGIAPSHSTVHKTVLDKQGQRRWIVGLCGEAFEMLAASFHGVALDFRQQFMGYPLAFRSGIDSNAMNFARCFSPLNRRKSGADSIQLSDQELDVFSNACDFFAIEQLLKDCRILAKPIKLMGLFNDEYGIMVFVRA